MGDLTDWRSAPSAPPPLSAPSARAARSSTAMAIGCSTTTWKSSSGMTKPRSPRTYRAIGMPRLAELTYPADSAPTTRSEAGRLSQSRAITM